MESQYILPETSVLVLIFSKHNFLAALSNIDKLLYLLFI